MTEHFTSEEAVALAKAAGFEVRRVLGLRESVPEVVFAHGLIDEEVTALCNAAYKLGRNAGLEEAKDIAEHQLVASAIESLKENTP